MEKAAAKYPQARKYQDWRELLEKEGDKIDVSAVLISLGMDTSVAIADGDLVLRDVGSSSWLTLDHDGDVMQLLCDAGSFLRRLAAERVGQVGSWQDWCAELRSEDEDRESV